MRDLLTPTSPLILTSSVRDRLVQQEQDAEDWHRRVLDMERWLARHFHAQGTHPSAFRDRWHFQTCCYAAVREQTGEVRAQALAPLISDVAGRMWLGFLFARDLPSLPEPLRTAA